MYPMRQGLRSICLLLLRTCHGQGQAAGVGISLKLAVSGPMVTVRTGICAVTPQQYMPLVQAVLD